MIRQAKSRAVTPHRCALTAKRGHRVAMKINNDDLCALRHDDGEARPLSSKSHHDDGDVAKSWRVQGKMVMWWGACQNVEMMM